MRSRLHWLDACVKSARLEDAQELLNAIPNVYQDSAYQQVKSAPDLAQQASDSPEIRALESPLAAEPENKQLQQELAGSTARRAFQTGSAGDAVRYSE